MSYRRIEDYDPEVTQQLAVHYKAILDLLGEDVQREGLLKTPERVAKAMQFLSQGYFEYPCEILRYAMFKEEYQQMVVVKDIELYSVLNIICCLSMVNVMLLNPDGYITGLSKIPRVVDSFARRFQVQERLTVQIRDCIQETLNPLGVAVVIEASHMCMQIRGVQKQHSITTTSAFTGAFLNSDKTRSEFIKLIGK